MNNGNVPLGIVVTAVNRASETLSQVRADTRRLADTFDTLKGRIRNAFQYHVINRGLVLIERALVSVASAIPDLIRRGRDWLDTVDDISDATGLSARKASELAAVQQSLGGSTDAVTRSMVAMSRSAVNNEAAWRKHGIATRDANGDLLDADRLIENVRRRTAALGSSQRTTAILSDLLGRSSKDLLDLFTLSPEAYARAARGASEAGLVVSGAAVAAAEAWKRAEAALGAAITGVGTQIAGGVAPVLTALTSGVTKAITSNIGAITEFVSRAVATVAGALGGLLGIDFRLGAFKDATPSFKEWVKTQRQVPDATNAATGSIERNTSAIRRRIDAIDRELAAMDRQQQRNDARRQHADLLADIADARRQLSDIRGDTIFASGMSEAEAELARQAQAARIMDGEKRLRDAKRAERDFDRTSEANARRAQLQAQREVLSRQLAAQRSFGRQVVAATTVTTAQLRRQYESIFGDKGDKKTALEKRLERVAKEAVATGKEIGRSVREAIFGKEETRQGWQGKFTVRADGLIDHLRKAGEAMANVAKWVGDLVGLIPDSLKAPLLTVGAGLAGFKLFVSPLLTVAKAIASLLPSIPIPGRTGTVPPVVTGNRRPSSGASSRSGGVGAGRFLGGVFGAQILNSLFYDPKGGSLDSYYDPDQTLPMGMAGIDRYWAEGTKSKGRAIDSLMGVLRGRERDRRTRSGRRSTLGGGFGGFDPLGMLMGTGSTWGVLGRSGGVGPGSPGVQSLPGFGMTLRPLEGVFRRFWGSDSPMTRRQAEATDAAATGATYASETAGNTQPLGSGTLGVVNDAFGNIGKVLGWSAGPLGTKVNDWSAGRLGTRVDDWSAGRLDTNVGNKVDTKITGTAGKIPVKAGKGDMSVTAQAAWDKAYLNKQSTHWKAMEAGASASITAKNRLGEGNVNQNLKNINANLKEIYKRLGGGTGGGRAAGGYIPPGWSGTVGETGREHIQMYPGGGAMVTSNANLPNVARASGGGAVVVQIVVENKLDGRAIGRALGAHRSTTSLKPVS